MEVDLITLELKLAFRQPGCPLCYLRHQVAQRYFHNLLWENVNDVEIRGHLVRALGFCPGHAWQLQQTEQSMWADGLGTAIIYEDLATRALGGLETYVTAQERRPTSSGWRQRWRGWLDQLQTRMFRRPAVDPDEGLPSELSPRERCRVCQIIDERETTWMIWLVKDCAEAEFREWYQASDGLCLPHLRKVLALDEQEEEGASAVLFLARTSCEKLARLTAQLREHLRKHSWQYHEEPVSPEEQSSWVRAVAFFAGEKSQRMLE